MQSGNNKAKLACKRKYNIQAKLGGYSKSTDK